MTSPARFHTPTNAAPPAMRSVSTKSTDSYIDEVAARMDLALGERATGPVQDAATQDLPVVSPEPQAASTRPAGEVAIEAARLEAIEAEMHRDPADVPTAEIPALAARHTPVRTRAQIHGAGRRTLFTRVFVAALGLLVAWLAVGVGAAFYHPLAFWTHLVATLTAIAVALGRPRHQGRHARGYVARHRR